MNSSFQRQRTSSVSSSATTTGDYIMLVPQQQAVDAPLSSAHPTQATETSTSTRPLRTQRTNRTPVSRKTRVALAQPSSTIIITPPETTGAPPTPPSTPAQRLASYDALEPVVASAPAASAVSPAETTTQTISSKEHFVEIIPDVRDLFINQPVQSFQNRVRPLTAPPQPDLTIELSRAHNEMNIYSLQSLYKQDWYRFLTLVRGLTHRPETDFITVQTFTPTRSRTDPYVGGGDASMSRYAQYGLQTLMTPLGAGSGAGGGGGGGGSGAPERSEIFSDRPPEGGDEGGGAVVSGGLESLEGQARGEQQSGASLLPDQLRIINESVLDNSNARQIRSGARFAELQKRIDNLHAEEMFGNSQLAEANAQQVRRDMRKAFADNSPWLNDPLQTTGFVVLSATYVSALEEAISLIRSHCTDTSLATVPVREYTRTRQQRQLPNGKLDTDWETVRAMFARLVADVFVQRRMIVGQVRELSSLSCVACARSLLQTTPGCAAQGRSGPYHRRDQREPFPNSPHSWLRRTRRIQNILHRDTAQR